MLRNGVRLGRAAVSAGDPLGTAAGFDGIDDRVRVPASASLDLGDALTIEAWVNPSRLPFSSRPALVAGRKDGYALRLDGPVVTAVIGRERPLRARSHPLVAGRAAHLVVTCAGGRLRIYIDGRLVIARKAGDAGTPSRKPLMIGDGFAGAIDEVAIYDRSLTAERVMAHARAGSPLR